MFDLELLHITYITCTQLIRRHNRTSGGFTFWHPRVTFVSVNVIYSRDTYLSVSFFDTFVLRHDSLQKNLLIRYIIWKRLTQIYRNSSRNQSLHVITCFIFVKKSVFYKMFLRPNYNYRQLPTLPTGKSATAYNENFLDH